MKRYVNVVGCVLLFVCAGARAASTLPVSGRVVNSRARPVAGAEVAVYETHEQARETYGRLIGPIVTTDEKGEFSLEAETTSQYGTFIVARKPGLALAWDGLNYSYNTLGKGHFLLVLEEPCTLTGVVVDQDGKPVAGAKVQAVPKTSYMSRLRQRPMYAPAEWFTTLTDDRGVFRFDAFAADVSSDFRVEAPGWNCTYLFTTHYQSSCGFDVGQSDIRLVLPAEHRVQGRAVQQGTDQGVAGVSLTIAAERDTEDIRNRYLGKTVVTGADGTFACEGVPEGKNRIAPAVEENETPAWVAEPAVVDVAADRPGQDVRVVLSKGGVIEALVREQATERPVAGHRVSAYGDQGYANSRTDEAGRVTLRVLPGEYKLYAGGEAYLSWHVSEPTVVKAGPTTHVDISLDKAPTIQGRVTDPNGKPVEDVLVTVHPFGDHIYTQAEGRFTAKYEMDRAEQGLYVIARGQARSLVGIVHARELQEPIEVSLSPSLTVSGRITDPNGRGIAAARASLCVELWNCLSGIGEETLTDSEGRFEFRAIPPVQDPLEYRISVHAAGYGPKTYKRIDMQGEPGSTANTEGIALSPTDLSVSGVVVDANGAPAPRVILFLRGESGGEQPEKTTATDEQGRFRITRICKGAIRIQVNFSSSPAGSGSLRGEAGDQDLKAVLGQNVVHQRFASLAGKPLPELSEMGISASDAAAESKAILVYFWDMQQRPSRSMLLQLAKQAEAIEDKSLVVLTVEVSGASRESLDGWMKQFNVPFPAGVLKGRFEEKKMAWGIKAVPWLVLTDKNHNVTAEGFAVGELDSKIETGKP
jgi:protocatechuate 3,4-dioxygenase beta subunit